LSFSENLILLQVKNKVTNYRLAKEIGVHPTTIQNWRNGKQPQLSHASKVAIFFGKTVDELMK